MYSYKTQDTWFLIQRGLWFFFLASFFIQVMCIFPESYICYKLCDDTVNTKPYELLEYMQICAVKPYEFPEYMQICVA